MTDHHRPAPQSAPLIEQFVAHTPNERDGVWHSLTHHIDAVAQRAQESASKFDAADFGYWAGVWHDIGKFHPEFQQYLRDAAANPGRNERGKDHKAAGSALAESHVPWLVPVIAGHHGGLRDVQGSVRPWFIDHAAQPRTAEAIAIARSVIPPARADCTTCAACVAADASPAGTSPAFHLLRARRR